MAECKASGGVFAPAFMFSAFSVSACIFLSTVLAFVGVRPFFNLWVIPIAAACGSVVPLYLLNAAFLLITAGLLIGAVRTLVGKSRSIGAFKITVTSAAVAFCLTFAAVCGFGLSGALGNKNSKAYAGDGFAVTYRKVLMVQPVTTDLYYEDVVDNVYTALGSELRFSRNFRGKFSTDKRIGGFGKIHLVIDTATACDDFDALGSRVQSVVFTDNVDNAEIGVLKSFDKLQSVTLSFVGLCDRLGGWTDTTPADAFFGNLFACEERLTEYSESADKYGDKYRRIVQTVRYTENMHNKQQQRAFFVPKSLKKVTVTGGEISSGAFTGCDFIQTLCIADDVGLFACDAFDSDSKFVQKENGVNYVGNWAVGCDKSITQMSLKEGTVGIARRAFENFVLLREAVFPASLERINEFAFYGCESLEKVRFAESTKWKSGYMRPQYDRDVTDAVVAATYLKNTYSADCWERADRTKKMRM